MLANRNGRLMPLLLNSFLCGEEVCTGVGSVKIGVGLTLMDSSFHAREEERMGLYFPCQSYANRK